MLITSKRQYVELAKAGLAGNSPQTWDTPREFLEQSDAELVGIRMYEAGSPKFRAFIRRDLLYQALRELDIQPGEYYLSTTVPSVEVRLAGELSWCEGQWVFYYSFVRKPMREALAEGGRHAYGDLAVWGLLRQYCTPEDIEDLHALFERYSPGHRYPVIELTVTVHDCGIFSGRNTLIWEVRHY